MAVLAAHQQARAGRKRGFPKPEMRTSSHVLSDHSIGGPASKRYGHSVRRCDVRTITPSFFVLSFRSKRVEDELSESQQEFQRARQASQDHIMKRLQGVLDASIEVAPRLWRTPEAPAAAASPLVPSSDPTEIDVNVAGEPLLFSATVRAHLQSQPVVAAAPQRPHKKPSWSV